MRPSLGRQGHKPEATWMSTLSLAHAHLGAATVSTEPSDRVLIGVDGEIPGPRSRTGEGRKSENRLFFRAGGFCAALW